MGQPGLIDRAYGLVCLLGIGLGVYWSCRFVQSAGLNAAWGLLFLAMPAIPVTVDRLVVNGGLAVLTAAFLYCGRSPSWKLYVVLACAALTRETGFLLVLAYCAHLVWLRTHRRAALFLSSTVPAVAWYGYVQANTAGAPYDMTPIPFAAILRVLANPGTYPPGIPFANAVRVADYPASAGMLLGFGLAFFWFCRKPRDLPHIAAALFAAMGLILYWPHAYDLGRIYTPVLLCLAAIAAEYRAPWLVAPVAMMLPRIAIQLTPQVLGPLH